MIQIQRHSWILGYLQEHEILSLRDGAAFLKTSVSTVRRDFDELAEQKLVKRVRGGICLERATSIPMLPFAFREAHYSQEKLLIAQEAAGLIKPHDVLFVDGGTTTFHLADHLPDIPLSLITNSTFLATALEQDKHVDRTKIEIFLTGGYLHPNSGFLVGPSAKANLIQYHANWAFLSVNGITERGISHTSEWVADVELAMMDNADKVVILADHSKIGRPARRQSCELERIHLLITDQWPDNEPVLRRFKEIGVEVIVVG